MSDEQDQGQDKTEEPTDKRRKDFRDKGQVANSKDLTSVGVLLALTLAMIGWWQPMLHELGAVGRTFFSDATRSPEIFMADPVRVIRLVVASCAWLTAPLLVAGAAAGFLFSAGQVGLAWSGKPLEPDIGRLNPLKGLQQKLFSAQAVAEWAKSMLKVAIIGVVAWKLWVRFSPGMAELSRLGVHDASRRMGVVIALLVAIVLGGMVPLAIGDLFFSRWQVMRKMRMTLEELKKETKEQEGDPQVRARTRRMMQELSQNRLVAEVSEATVIVANPTHFAVALAYEMGQPGAPRVVARGKGVMAQRIKEIARSKGIPRVENRPLARALYAQCRAGQEVPPGTYEAVAEVLAFVYRLREARRAGGQPPPTAS